MLTNPYNNKKEYMTLVQIIVGSVFLVMYCIAMYYIVEAYLKTANSFVNEWARERKLGMLTATIAASCAWLYSVCAIVKGFLFDKRHIKPTRPADLICGFVMFFVSTITIIINAVSIVEIIRPSAIDMMAAGMMLQVTFIVGTLVTVIINIVAWVFSKKNINNAPVEAQIDLKDIN